MSNLEHKTILKQGVAKWNQWRLEHPDVHHPDLIGIDLVEANLAHARLNGAFLGQSNLAGIELRWADLSGADLSEAILNNANLRQTNLTNANLNEAVLVGCDLSGANLEKANLTQAKLLYAKLNDANLAGAKLQKAEFGDTEIGKCNLCYAIGLEDVFHAFPSMVGLPTIQLSKGKIPIEFLRGCGLSDLEIEFAKLANSSLDPEQVTDITYKIHQLYLGGGIQYYSCFISYSNKDHELAQQLYDDLQNNGVRCWFDREDLKIGDPIRSTIDHQIRLRDKLLVILSANSIKSEWVGDEVEGALEEEQKGNRSVLFPIRLDDTVLNTRDDWAAKIKRRRHIGDFSNWKDKASYQKAFERLLRDLKASSEIGSKDELE